MDKGNIIHGTVVKTMQLNSFRKMDGLRMYTIMQDHIVTERENNVLMYVCKYMHVWIQYNVKKGEQKTLAKYRGRRAE